MDPGLDLDKRKPVIVVDDEDVILDLIGTFLTMNGFTDIRKASNGQKAWITILNCNPCLVITDIDMPIMDGLQLIKQIRKKHRFIDVPILALTANKEKEKVIQILRSGVDGYLIKEALKEDELIYRIADAVIKRREKAL
ncbi:MAG: response regulator [Deltaproteobacteria bacterium]|jgi:two-component system, chemotaxis family, chemotaxis protein CheY|nr:response regulator [Deltaproteobacteria bacterium]